MKEVTFKSLAIRSDAEGLFLLDQRALPDDEIWIQIKTIDDMVEAIAELKTRGAPMIGVAALAALALGIEQDLSTEQLLEASSKLRQSRPTAVNLMNALDRFNTALQSGQSRPQLQQLIRDFIQEDFDLCDHMAGHGAALVKTGERLLTHCNTGSLATVGVGTALGVIRKAHQQDKDIHVYVDETRPLLQGGRLTTYELGKEQIPHTLIADNMAGFLMAQGKIDRIFVGAARIAINGDFANKIGTYTVAVLAKHHNIPFYVVAPYTTIDQDCASGSEIPIEERKPQEVRGFVSQKQPVRWAPESVDVYNPAFDVVPAELVTGWITEKGVFELSDVNNGILKGS